MSYIKNTLRNLISATNSIQDKTFQDNDLTAILEGLNCVMEISESFTSKDSELEFYWNEIISELIAVIYSSISGHSKLGITGLRNILELTCHCFYYFDHKIELKISINENISADKYVNVLVTKHSFFTSKYIKTFFSTIKDVEVEEDSISKSLTNEYAKLCDVVHGRHKTLLKQNKLEIKYSKIDFKKFENHFLNVIGIISTMYVVRFDDFTNASIINSANRVKLINI